MEDGEMKVNFGSTNGMDAPLGIIVLEHFVPVVEWLWCEEFLKEANHARIGDVHHSISEYWPP